MAEIQKKQTRSCIEYTIGEFLVTHSSYNDQSQRNHISVYQENKLVAETYHHSNHGTMEKTPSSWFAENKELFVELPELVAYLPGETE